MTVLYFDPVNGSDANSGTESAPKRNLGNITPAAGTSYLNKRGTESVMAATSPWVLAGGVTVNGVYLGAYGESTVPYATLRQADYGVNCLNIAHCDGVTVEDLFLKSAGTLQEAVAGGYAEVGRALSIHAQTANTSNVTVRRVKAEATEAKSNGTTDPALMNYVDGIAVTSGMYSDFTGFISSNVLLEDISIENCGGHGLNISSGVANVVCRRALLADNGQDISTHAFSSGVYPTYFAADLTWTNTVGNTWQTQPLTGGTPTLVSQNAINGDNYRQDTNTPTVPAPTKWGWDGSRVYYTFAAFSSVPPELNICFGSMTNVLVADSIARGQMIGVLNAGQEGTGFQCDDYAQNIIFRNCQSYDHYGSSYYLHHSNGISILGCVAQGTSAGGITMRGGGLDVQILNNTLISPSSFIPYMIESNGRHDGLTIRNNALICENVLFGMYVAASNPPINVTCSHNYINGATARSFGITETTPLSGTKLFDTAWRPARNSVCAAAGFDSSAVVGLTDISGGRRYVPMTVGALEAAWPKYAVRSLRQVPR